MTTLAMDTALVQPVVADFLAVEVLLPFYSLRLIRGASEVRFSDGRLFKGEDDTYGTLGGLQAITEGLGTEAPTTRFVIYPPTRTAAAQLNLPGNQGSEFTLWYGVMDVDTGAVLGTEQLMWGYLNQPRFSGAKKMAVEMDVSSVLDAMFNNEEGQRLNHEFQTKVFPGDMGLEFVVDVERKEPWGSEAASPPIVSAAGAGYATGLSGLNFRGGM
ncbi:hypothetical protein W2_gp017 [Caulobacter phage W2]|uniref:Uncharacterized protein n=2 Tax=Kronosvirus TaxID=3425745 RepID=A0A386KRQ6_9CAUD|nr:hypothetical protein [Caulobacter phage Kronos]WDS38326.1 hypothetical protein TMCBR4_gp017 [Caulobacter phage TMCBR4]WDS38385.1 hypothetical protein W2_gp017 [Caulobacter phage W2]